MVIQRRRFQKKDGLGFTLVELLLVVALLMGLLGAMVYNFGTARRGADLDEGGRQFESLVRWAGAYAANTGRAVQFRFGMEASTNSTTGDLARLRIVWEADPVSLPGEFVELAEAAPMVESFNDRVRVESVNAPGRPVNISTNEMALEQKVERLPALTFFADGSSDTAEIVLASNDAEDFRRLTIHLDGVTGGLRSELSVSEDLTPLEWMDDEEMAGKSERVVATEPVDNFDRPTTSEAKQTNEFDADFP